MEEIHDDWMRNLISNVPALSIERLHATRRLLEQALPEALVGYFHHYIEAIKLPDPMARRLRSHASAL